jgi:hypothetical protein
MVSESSEIKQFRIISVGFIVFRLILKWEQTRGPNPSKEKKRCFEKERNLPNCHKLSHIP